MGLLGSDVLDRFGAVRIDYRSHLLTVAGPEGARSTPSSLTMLPATGAHLPLVGPGSTAPIPLQVTTGASGVAVEAQVTFGSRGPFPFAVSTGTATSEVTASLGALLGLAKTGHSQPVTAFGCPQEGPTLDSGRWATGSVALPTGAMVAGVAATAPPGVSGALGSNTLSVNGSLVLDYRDGWMYLGAGSLPS
jgi:hypothetical protein